MRRLLTKNVGLQPNRERSQNKAFRLKENNEVTERKISRSLVKGFKVIYMLI